MGNNKIIPHHPDCPSYNAKNSQGQKMIRLTPFNTQSFKAAVIQRLQFRPKKRKNPKLCVLPQAVSFESSHHRRNGSHTKPRHWRAILQGRISLGVLQTKFLTLLGICSLRSLARQTLSPL
ncbi:hypothetical protein L484_006252 [Morus notabilis]|uniref:Uncharacterized protein n=1 Tax=Morus notabilis TaxID=981085 RepID=W9RDK9_9ROSA|nr:hypothetical protein L484_006252 [Morus notabilis]